ncbi:sensor domain-containing protein [Nocardiopsis potens]|uniref:sensor domain-containing protein n=1 Tax=Nocardiopsis potens TaxID=1246458 RepID=UPI000345B2B2|nr:sensor domain-containing protein [Nocardiopsis potens]
MSNIIRRAGADTRYLITGFPLAVVSFCLLVPVFAAGLGTAVIVGGLFALGLALIIARGFAAVERQASAEVLARPIDAPRYRRPPEGAGWFRAGITPLTCGQSWMDLGHGILRLPLAVASFAITVSWWAVAIGGLLYPAYGWALHRIPGNQGLPELLGHGGDLRTGIAFHLVLGALFALLLPVVLRFLAQLNAGFAKAFLSPVAPVRPGSAGPPHPPYPYPQAPSADPASAYAMR